MTPRTLRAAPILPARLPARLPACLLPLLALGCSGGKDSAADTAPTPAEVAAALTVPGPWPVGYTAGSLTYGAPDGSRTLRLAAWYPAGSGADGSAGAAPEYHRQDTAVPVTTDAGIAGQTFPVAIYSHGHMGYAEVSSFLCEHLASHGWIVLAPDHTGNTISDGSARTTEIYYQRPLDLSAVLDALEAGGLLGGLLDGHADPGPRLALGHSFGGYTVLALAGAAYDAAVMDACVPGGDGFCSTMDSARRARFEAGFRDDRVGMTVAMAPGDYALFGAAGLAAIPSPVLHMTATLDQPEGSEGDAIWSGLQGGAGDQDRRMILLDGGHQSFTDFADQLEQVPLDAAAGFLPVRGYALAAGRTLRGDAAVSPVWSGGIALSDDAVWSVD